MLLGRAKPVLARCLRRKYHLVELAAARALYRRGIRRVRGHIGVLARHEARTDVLSAERAHRRVREEVAATRGDPPALGAPRLHAAILGTWPRSDPKVARRSRPRPRR